MYEIPLKTFFTPLLASCLDRSLRDKLNKLFNAIAIAIRRTIPLITSLNISNGLLFSSSNGG